MPNCTEQQYQSIWGQMSLDVCMPRLSSIFHVHQNHVKWHCLVQMPTLPTKMHLNRYPCSALWLIPWKCAPSILQPVWLDACQDGAITKWTLSRRSSNRTGSHSWRNLPKLYNSGMRQPRTMQEIANTNVCHFNFCLHSILLVCEKWCCHMCNNS